RVGPGGGLAAEPGLPRAQLRAEPVRATVPAALDRGGAGLPVAALAGVRRRQPGADADRRGHAPHQLLRRPRHRHVVGHRHGGLAVRLLRHPADPGAAAGHQPQALRGRRRLGRGHPPRLLGRHPAQPAHHADRDRPPARHLDVQQVRLHLAGDSRRPPQGHRDPPAVRLPSGLRGVRLRPRRRGLHRDVRGAAGGRGRLLQAVRPHPGDRGGTVSRLRAYGPFALLLVVLVLVAFPFYWMVLTSFRPRYRFVRLDLSLGNYRELLFATEFVRYFANSLIAAVGAIVLNVIAATLAGYGLTRFAFPGKKTFAFGTLFSYMFPPMLMAIPLYILFSALKMRNTYTGLILAHMAISLPLNIWLMWQYFQIVPPSLEEAAWVSGASRLRALGQVCLPSARPGILSVAIFSFALSWNDFTFAFLLQTDRKMFTLPVGLATFVEQTGVHWGMVMAAAVLVSVPTFLLVFFLQRYLLSGLRTAG